jgi:hypothetical protein
MGARGPLPAGTCRAHRLDGQVCGAPATIIDEQQGGGVCAYHAHPLAVWLRTVVGWLPWAPADEDDEPPDDQVVH